MKSIYCFCFVVCLICCFIFSTTTFGQVRVAPNGKFETVDGLKFYYEETGKGFPLILLHGFKGSTSYWKSFVPELSRFYKVIAVDLPGHGRSDYMDTTEVYSHKKAAEYILGLLHQLDMDSIFVMGGSSGGIIALHMATLKPDVCKRIVVMAGQTYFSAQTRKVIADRGPGKAGENTKQNLLLRQFWHFRKLYGDPAFTPDLLSTVQAKTLIIHGDKDDIAPVSNAWEMYQHIPNANLWIIPNGAHGFMFDPANHSVLERRILEFLRGDWEKDKK